MRRLTPYIVIICFMLSFGCTTDNKQGRTYTSGSTKIIADESFFPIIDDQLYVFKNRYPKADVEISYLPENQLINEFLSDKARIVILPRELKPHEAKVYENKNIRVRSTRFAVDAIALISHKSINDTTVDVSEIIDAMKGNSGSIKRLVFDNANSSTVQYLMNLAGIKLLPEKGVYALKSNPEVIKYVYNNPGAIGVIGVNWIRQPGKELEKYLKEIKVLGVKNLPGKPGSDNYYKPSQDNLAMGLYPLTRDLYIINCSGGPSAGAGFASFLAGEVGQRIILKSGLLPDSVPPREILIRK